jgi:hypothetical protein
MPDAGTTTETEVATPVTDDAARDPSDAAASGPDLPAVVDDAKDDDAQLDAALHAITSGQGRAAATEAYAAAAPGAPAAAPAKVPPASAKPEAQAGEGTTPDAQPFAPSDEQRQLLQRFKVRESSFAKLDPDERVELLANLKERHDAQAAMWQENQQLKRGQPAASAATPATPQAPGTTATAPATPIVKDAFARVQELLSPFLDEGASVAEPLRQAVNDAIGPVLQQAQAAEARAQAAEAGMAAHWSNVAEASKSEGLAAAKDSGVNLDKRTTEGKANVEKLMTVAERLLSAAQQQQGWTPYTYGWKDAISEALPSTFKAQTILAQRKRSADEARKTARGGADPGGLPNRTKQPESEDAVLDRILDAQKQGATRHELERIGAGRG